MRNLNEENCLLPKPDDLNSIPGTHTKAEEENLLQNVVVWPPPVDCGMRVQPILRHTQTQVINKTKLKTTHVIIFIFRAYTGDNFSVSSA